MLIYQNMDGSTGKINHSSKGNQLKMNLNNKWYKADFLGYESAAEYFSSELLKVSNIKDYVTYKMCPIVYNERTYNGCVSDNFLRENEELITLERLFKTNYNHSILYEIKNKKLDKKIQYVVDQVIELTGWIDSALI